MTASPSAPSIAGRLRDLRTRQQLSLDRTAERTGISKAMLGQIERGESSPTIATLWKIATGLNVSLSYFLAEIAGDAANVRHHPIADHWHEDNAGMRTRALLPFDEKLGFEMFVVEFAPGASSLSAPHAAGTIEHVVMLDGELEVEFDNQRHQLHAGDVLQFTADRLHRYHNVGKTRARAHDLIHYPR